MVCIGEPVFLCLISLFELFLVICCDELAEIDKKHSSLLCLGSFQTIFDSWGRGEGEGWRGAREV